MIDLAESVPVFGHSQTLELIEELGRQALCAASRAELEFVVALHKAVVDEGDRKSQQHYSAHDTQATKHTSRHSDGVHVSIADSGHGDNNPPAGGRNASVLLVPGLQIQAVL